MHLQTSPTSCLQARTTRESDAIGREGPVSVGQPGIVRAPSGLITGTSTTVPATAGRKPTPTTSISCGGSFCCLTNRCLQSCRVCSGMDRQTSPLKRQKRSLCTPFPKRTKPQNMPSRTLSCTSCSGKAALGRCGPDSDRRTGRRRWSRCCRNKSTICRCF